MKAIYKGKLYRVGDNLAMMELIDMDTNAITHVPWGDHELIVDPTDDQVNNILPDSFDDPAA